MKRTFASILCFIILCSLMMSFTVSAREVADEFTPQLAMTVNMRGIIYSWDNIPDATYYTLTVSSQTDEVLTCVTTTENTYTDSMGNSIGNDEIYSLKLNIYAFDKDDMLIARSHELVYNIMAAGVYDWIAFLGDCDYNFEVNIKDATLLQKHLAQLIQLNYFQCLAADANFDSDVDIKDVTEIQRYCAGIETERVGNEIGDGGILFRIEII